MTRATVCRRVGMRVEQLKCCAVRVTSWVGWPRWGGGRRVEEYARMVSAFLCYLSTLRCSIASGTVTRNETIKR